MPAFCSSLASSEQIAFPSLARYKSLCPETWPRWDGRPHDGVAVLLKHLGYKQEEYKMGRFVSGIFGITVLLAVKGPWDACV